MIYLDHAAATPLDDRVRAAMQPFEQARFFNPSAIYTAARQVREEVDGFRRQIAGQLGAKPSEVIFTAGATESINLAVAGTTRAHPGSTVAVSAIEHKAVRVSGTGYAEKVIALPVRSDGRLQLEEIATGITDEVVLISVALVNGEVGVIQSLSKIAALLQDIRLERQQRGVSRPLFLHSDASQAPEYIDIQVQKLGVDLLTLNGGKIYGPKQSGILYVRHGIELAPLIYGGGQERGLRGGTESVAALAGFATALEIAQAGQRSEAQRQTALQRQLLQGLSTIADTEVNGSLKHRIPGNVNVSFRGVNGEMLVHHLDTHGILAATGAACNAGGTEPSATLMALGCDKDRLTGSLRFSLGRSTTTADINTLLTVLHELVPKLRQR
ncbi:MAG: cysteine desulfurase family protein [Candidatus Saccharimonadales bacterium]